MSSTVLDTENTNKKTRIRVTTDSLKVVCVGGRVMGSGSRTYQSCDITYVFPDLDRMKVYEM